MKSDLPGARRLRLLAEMCLIYGLAPLVIRLEFVHIQWLIPCMIISATASGIYLCRDPGFDRARLWNFSGFLARKAVVLRIFAGGAVVLTLVMLGLMLARRAALFHVPEQVDWFSFILERPLVYATVMIAYPLFSVYAQEVMYRGLFFQRYAPAFKTTKHAVLANAAFFAWGHIIFRNPIAVILTFLGGILFSWTYIRSRSLLAASIEHSLYGCLIFTLGLGFYFYGGSAQAMEDRLMHILGMIR